MTMEQRSDLMGVHDIARELAAQRELLGRIDERTQNLAGDIAEIRRTMVTRPEFAPVRAVAYGMVALLVAGVVAALLNVVLKAPR